MSGEAKQTITPQAGGEANQVFARMEEWGARAGLALICVGALLYSTGWLESYIPVEKLQVNWRLPAGEFARAVGMPTGWDWLPYIWHSDMLGFAGLLLLAGASIGAYLAILPVFIRQRDIIYAVLVVLQLGVFVLAAGGWLTAH